MKAAADDDDAATHKGRKRTFAHERGIWATYVFIACKLEQFGYNFARFINDQPSFSGPRSESIEKLQRTLKSRIESNIDNMEMHPMEELHMSLTRTVILRHHWIDEFIRSVTNATQSYSR